MSLFLKIFLWFWLAMASLGLALLAVQISTQEDWVLPARRGFLLDAMENYGRRAVMVHRKYGVSGLDAYLRKLERRAKIRAHLFDSKGQQLDGRPAPAEVRQLARETARFSQKNGQKNGEERAQFELSNSRVATAQPIPTERGTFVLVAAAPRSLFGATRQSVRNRILRWLAVIVTAGLVCYALARTLAAPVSRLRLATQKLATGDLSARVGHPQKPIRGRDELAHLARDFDAMAARLETLVTAQNRLLGDVSHELRSPLARLHLALELARRGQSGALDRIEREAARLETLIGELLSLSRWENGLPTALTNFGPLDVRALAQEVANDAKFEAKNAGRGVHIEFLAPAEPLEVEGDAELLRRALENIVRNALRYTADDSRVEIELREEANTNEASAENDVVFRVKDGGEGVPEAELEAIFQPFYRAEASRERGRDEAGTGLGLAIARRAVMAHNGKIVARNRSEGGLEVEIRLSKRGGRS